MKRKVGVWAIEALTGPSNRRAGIWAPYALEAGGESTHYLMFSKADAEQHLRTIKASALWRALVDIGIYTRLRVMRYERAGQG